MDENTEHNTSIKHKSKKRKRNKSEDDTEDVQPSLDTSVNNVTSPSKHKSKKVKKGKQAVNVEAHSSNINAEIADSNAMNTYDDCDSPESVDSGCVPDKTVEGEGVSVDWGEIKNMLHAAHNYVTSLLDHIPGASEEPVQNQENALDDESSDDDEKPKEKKKKKPARVSDYEDLEKRWNDKLNSLKQNKSKKLKKAPRIIKQEKALKKKLKRVKQRKKTAEKKLANMHDETECSSSDKRGKLKCSKRIYNAYGELVFNKFDFRSRATNDKNLNKKSLLKSLKLALDHKKKVKTLTKTGELDKAVAIKETHAWEGALSRAQGEKVKDDVDLLKKSIKKKDMKKSQSKKKWEERTQNTEKRMADKQKQRRDNLQSRKHDAINKKMQKMKNRGHIVPGF